MKSFSSSANSDLRILAVFLMGVSLGVSLTLIFMMYRDADRPRVEGPDRSAEVERPQP
ncbi:MAG: hypothetical protein RLY93_10325 [Sumerlaeia bacterium]